MRDAPPALVLPYVALLFGGCYSPRNPIVVMDESSAGSESSASETTTSPSTSASDPSSSEASTQTSSPDPDSSTSLEGSSSTSTTGSQSCDIFADECEGGTLCDGVGCVEPRPGAVAVPGGPFMMGCNEDLDPDCQADEYPYHEVTLSSFSIDRTEVTASAYAECVDDGTCSAPAVQTAFDQECGNTVGEQPIVCVNWFQAEEFCTWRGGLLPTEAQWEKAARGTDGRIFPWGNEAPTCNLANYDGCEVPSDLLPVGSKPAGASPYGALDMGGNVFEWVADWYSPSYYLESESENPTGPEDGTRRALRSSAYYFFGSATRASLRSPDYDVPTPYDANRTVGFRCAYPPPYE